MMEISSEVSALRPGLASKVGLDCTLRVCSASFFMQMSAQLVCWKRYIAAFLS